MSTFFNFSLTFFLLIFGNCLSYALNIFISNGFGNVYPILNSANVVFEIIIPLMSFVFVIGYLFSHYRDWQDGFSWKIFIRWFLLVLFILPWLFHFQPNGTSISSVDTFSSRSKPDSGFMWFVELIRLLEIMTRKSLQRFVSVKKL